MSLRASQSHKRKPCFKNPRAGDITQGECSPSMCKAPTSVNTMVLILDGIQIEDKTEWLHGSPREDTLFPTSLLSMWHHLLENRQGVGMRQKQAMRWIQSCSPEHPHKGHKAIRKELGDLSWVMLFLIQKPLDFWRTHAFVYGKEIKASGNPSG